MAAPGTSWRDIGDCPRRPESKIPPDVALDFLSFVADTILSLVKMPVGKRPMRVVVDNLSGGPIKAMNEQYLGHRQRILAAFGLG